MRILIACEYSGKVRDAFAIRGHEAWSCDLLPTESPGLHLCGDVLQFLGECQANNYRGWDLIIAHPPCTYVCGSGIHWNARRPERAAQTSQAVEFARQIWQSKCPRIALENPIGILSREENLGKPSQIIQPYQFGHNASKATCLWLKGLPNLKHGEYVAPRIVGRLKRWGNQTDSGQNKLAPSVDRWKLRAETYAGIASAMAEQWGNLDQFQLCRS